MLLPIFIENIFYRILKKKKQDSLKIQADVCDFLLFLFCLVFFPHKGIFVM